MPISDATENVANVLIADRWDQVRPALFTLGVEPYNKAYLTTDVQTRDGEWIVVIGRSGEYTLQRTKRNFRRIVVTGNSAHGRLITMAQYSRVGHDPIIVEYV